MAGFLNESRLAPLMNSRIAVLLLMALALAPAAHAQDDFDVADTSTVRIAIGDVPRTAAVEPAGALNVIEYIKLDHDGNNTQVAYTLDSGTLLTATCDCGSASRTGNVITIGNDVPAGPIVVVLGHSHAFNQTAFVPLALAHDNRDASVTFYLAPAYGVESSAKPAATLPGADFDGTVTQYATTDAWFAVRPAAAGAYVAPEIVTKEVPTGNGINFTSILIGLIAGVAVWYVLVKQGLVQKQRKQEVAVAAHKEVAAAAPRPVLEGRKRLLMAALKDLEMARMNKEIEDDAYDTLKADFKKQAVTTMRALEESG